MLQLGKNGLTPAGAAPHPCVINCRVSPAKVSVIQVGLARRGRWARFSYTVSPRQDIGDLRSQTRITRSADPDQSWHRTVRFLSDVFHAHGDHRMGCRPVGQQRRRLL